MSFQSCKARFETSCIRWAGIDQQTKILLKILKENEQEVRDKKRGRKNAISF
jgi:hypothetical protein